MTKNLTIKQAKEKRCPFVADSQGNRFYCVAKECMAWEVFPVRCVCNDDECSCGKGRGNEGTCRLIP